MLGKSFSVAAGAALAVASIWACSSKTTSIPDPDAGASDLDDSGTALDDAPSSTGPETGAAGPTITYGNCPAFTKCGGDIVGSWHLTGGCLSEQTFAQAKTACPALKESNVLIHATGTMEVTATEITRATAITVTGHVEVPKSCVPLPGASCALVASFLQNPTIFPGGLSFKTATCADNATDATLCECDVGTDYSENVDTTYTSTPDGTLTTPPVTGSSSPRTYEYCIAGPVLTFTETSQSQPLRFYPTLSK